MKTKQPAERREADYRLSKWMLKNMEQFLTPDEIETIWTELLSFYEPVTASVENGTRIRPALTMPIEAYMARMGAPVDAEPENHLMIATTEDFLYGASVVMYPGFLERISGGKNLYLIPSSIHEWLYIEDRGIFTQEELTSLLRSVNSEIVSEEEILSDHLYYYEGKEIRQV